MRTARRYAEVLTARILAAGRRQPTAVNRLPSTDCRQPGNVDILWSAPAASTDTRAIRPTGLSGSHQGRTAAPEAAHLIVTSTTLTEAAADR
jgi:hypothetical protein